MATHLEDLYQKAVGLIMFRRGTDEQRKERDLLLELFSYTEDSEQYRAQPYIDWLILLS